MAVNTPRFRVYRGRVMDMDSANLQNIGSRWDANDTADQKLVSRQLQTFPSSGSLQGMTLQNVGVRNTTKQSFDVFVGGRINPTDLAGTSNANVCMGTWTDAGGGAFALDTSPVTQSGANTGVVYAANRAFNTIVTKPNAVRNNDGNVDKFFYWNGSAWSALDTYLLTHPLLSNNSDECDSGYLFWEANVFNSIIFSPPSDWAKVTSTTRPDADNDDLDGFYPILHKLTAVAGAIPEITSVEIGNVRASFPGVSTGAFMAETQSTPICSVDEAPWIVLNQGIDNGASSLYLTVHLTCEKHNYTGTIGE